MNPLKKAENLTYCAFKIISEDSMKKKNTICYYVIQISHCYSRCCYITRQGSSLVSLRREWGDPQSSAFIRKIPRLHNPTWKKRFGSEITLVGDTEWRLQPRNCNENRPAARQRYFKRSDQGSLKANAHTLLFVITTSCLTACDMKRDPCKPGVQSLV